MGSLLQLRLFNRNPDSCRETSTDDIRRSLHSPYPRYPYDMRNYLPRALNIGESVSHLSASPHGTIEIIWPTKTPLE